MLNSRQENKDFTGLPLPVCLLNLKSAFGKVPLNTISQKSDVPRAPALITSDLQNNMASHIESRAKNKDEPRCASCIQPLIAKAELHHWSLLAHKDNKRPVRQLKEVGQLLKLLAHTHLLIVYLLSLSLS